MCATSRGWGDLIQELRNSQSEKRRSGGRVVTGFPRVHIARTLVLGLPLLWIGIADAQVTYAPVEVPGIVVTGIRSNSSTTDDVVVTGSAITAGVTAATLYSGSLQALPTAPSFGLEHPHAEFRVEPNGNKFDFLWPEYASIRCQPSGGECARRRQLQIFHRSQSGLRSWHDLPGAGDGWRDLDPDRSDDSCAVWRDAEEHHCP